MKPSYPDISEILSAKAGRRQALAALSWEEKIAIIEQMQQLLPQGMWKDRVADKKRTRPGSRRPTTASRRTG